MKVLLEEATSKEFEELLKKTKTVLIPVGSVEAHGPHLPLATDLYTIYGVCKRVGEKISVAVAPPIYYGLCRSTKNTPGTISIKGGILKVLLLDIMHEFYRWGFRNFFILSGHAGTTHNGYLVDAGETFIETHADVKVFVADICRLLAPFLKELNVPETDSHAGEWEASMIMYLKPNLKREGGFEDYPKFKKFWIVREKEKYWSSGIWGNPLKATKEKGEFLVERLVDYLCKEIEKAEANE